MTSDITETAPSVLLTAGIDVARDGFTMEVIGWRRDLAPPETLWSCRTPRPLACLAEQLVAPSHRHFPVSGES